MVLNLAATPDALAKRILDFSFGVASALDANVECVGNKVFALTRIDELTEAEHSYLRHPGHHLAPDTPSRPSDKGAC